MKQERRQNGRCNRVARLEKPDGLSEARDFSHGFFTKLPKTELEYVWKCYGNLKIIEKNTYNDESFKNYYSAMQEETKKFWKTRML